MSYDLNIWSVRRFDPSFLPEPGKWDHSSQDFWRLPGKGWQIALAASARAEPDDIPEEVAEILPGIGWLTELHLEGDAPATARALLKKSAKAIARAAHGVVEDPQQGQFLTPAGIKRYIPPKADKKFTILHLSWWFMTDPLETADGRDAFLALLHSCLPEALPKRYGTCEPPEHKLEETGRDHLRKFIGDNLHDLIVWYPRRPVASVHLRCPKPPGGQPLGFRSNHLDIEIESAVLDQPGWKETLDRLWLRMTRLLKPFYGELRSEGNQIRMGATVGMLAADSHFNFNDTTRGWFWRGVPRNLGHAVVLGPDYQKLWPRFLTHAQMRDGFAFASAARWSGDSPKADVSSLVGPPPDDIVLLPGEGMGLHQKYPKTWPFGPPHG